jgi:hypothetical protein
MQKPHAPTTRQRCGLAVRAATSTSTISTPPPRRRCWRPARLVTNKERQRHRQCGLAVAEADERTMPAWRENLPQDVVDENAFLVQQHAEHKAAREGKGARKAFILALLL